MTSYYHVTAISTDGERTDAMMIGNSDDLAVAERAAREMFPDAASLTVAPTTREQVERAIVLTLLRDATSALGETSHARSVH